MFLELRPEVWVPSSCHGALREPLMLSLGSQESVRVVRSLSIFLSSWCRGLGPHLVVRQETQGSTPTRTGILLQGNEALSQVNGDFSVFSNGGPTPGLLSCFKVRMASS